MSQQQDGSPLNYILRAAGIQMRYGEVAVLKDVNLEVSAGKTMVILGNSGCGKTTLLKIVSGQLWPQAGKVWLQHHVLHELAPSQRGVVYLDQEALLFEHLNVYENVAFALRLRKVSSADVDSQVWQILERISLAEHARKKSHQLSGGQKQRVAFARAIIAKPKIMLLDEPFSSLDDRTRTMMQELYKSLCAEFGITALFVTHDVKEALLVGDVFGYMDEGKLDTYTSQEAFRLDPRTGVQQEIRFWTSVQARPSD